MGNPVVHFEILGQDAALLHAFYGELFGWRVDTANPIGYGLVARDENLNADGVGIGGGIGAATGAHTGHVTFYVEVPDVEAALVRAETLGGMRMMGPEAVMGMVVVGMFTDPEGRLIGLVGSDPPAAD